MTDENRTGGETTGAVEQAGTPETPAPRRRRRAAAPAGPPGAVPADGVTDAGTAPSSAEAPTTEPAPRRARARSGSASAKDAASAQASTSATDATAAKGSGAAKGSTSAKRTTRKAAATPGGSPDAPAATTEAPASDAPAADAPAAPARRSRTRTAKAAAEGTPDATPDATPAAEADASAPDTTDERPAPARRRQSTRRAGGRSSAATEVPADASDGTSATGSAPTDAPAADAPAAGGRGGAPRLATTALLFQAPEPSTGRPRRRRAEAPAGPPRHADEHAATEAEDAVVVAEEVVAEEVVEDATPEELEQAQAAEPDEHDETGEPDEEQDEERDRDGREGGSRRRRRRGGRGRRGRSGERGEPGDEADASAGDTRAEDAPAEATASEGGEDAEAGEAADRTDGEQGEQGEGSSSSRRRRRRRRSRGEGGEDAAETRPRGRQRSDEVTALKGSTRLEAKRQRRREGRDAGRRRAVITEAEFLARRESVERTMVVREIGERVQIAILEDGVLVEHYVSRAAAATQAPMAGNVYLGRVQNVLPSMEAAFVDIGKGRNAVLYAGEVNWDAAGLEGQPRRIEQALKSGDSVLVQVTKEPVGHKGARLTSQITLAGRYLVYVPGGGMTGISRKLPENERARLKKILREIVPDDAGVIVRTAAEGASDDELRRDVQRLQDQWTAIQKKAGTASPPSLLQGEPDLAIRVVRDVFNDDFDALVVQGAGTWDTISDYVGAMAPDLAGKVSRWDGDGDVFTAHRVEEQLAKGMERKVWLPSGGSLVIDRTEAMTVIDVNTGKFTGSGGTLEETVTRNNLEAAEEIVRQLRLRDVGGIIVIDFIDMVLESNRDLVLRRLVECLGRDRTKHQVAEVTSLGLVQMTRKRVGQGLFEAFSEACPHCGGRGYLVHSEPVTRSNGEAPAAAEPEPKKGRRKRAAAASSGTPAPAVPAVPVLPEAREAVKATLATIAAAAAHAHEQASAHHDDDVPVTDVPETDMPVTDVPETDAPDVAEATAPGE